MTDESTQAKPKRASKAKTPATPTEYVVMEKVEVSFTEGDKDDIPTWVEAGSITASGQEKALIEKWAAEQKRTGFFKLVPARSWKGGARVFEKTSLTSEAIA